MAILKTALLLFALLAALGCSRQPEAKAPAQPAGPDLSWNIAFRDSVVLERKFASLCLRMSSMPGSPELQDEVSALMAKACAAGACGRMMRIAERYLWDPNSPWRNEESMIPFLRFAAGSPLVDEADKVRPCAMLESALMNRKGTLAADFEFVGVGGKTGSLYETEASCTVLCFFNPECHDCKRAREILENDEELNRLIAKGRVRLMAVYPDEDLGAWERGAAAMPEGWDVVRFATDEDRDKYDIRAIPSIYVLDGSKRVACKDISLEAFLAFLRIAEWIK